MPVYQYNGIPVQQYSGILAYQCTRVLVYQSTLWQYTNVLFTDIMVDMRPIQSRSTVDVWSIYGRTRENMRIIWGSYEDHMGLIWATYLGCSFVPKQGPTSAEQRLPKAKNSEDPSGSVRDITADFIHDKNTLIAVPSIVFNEESAGYDPRRIYWSYEFYFFWPWGLRARRAAQTRPGGQNLAFQRFDPMIVCSF